MKTCSKTNITGYQRVKFNRIQHKLICQLSFCEKSAKVVAEEQMYFEAGKVWGLGVCWVVARVWFLRTRKLLMLPRVFSHQSYKIFNIWHKKKVNFRIFWCSARGRVTRSGKFDCVSSFCSCDPFETLFLLNLCSSLKQLLSK